MRKNLRILGLSIVALGVVTLVAASEDAADGKALYDKKCAMCHGTDGVAKKMGEGSANFNDPEWQKANAVDAIVKVTAEGKGKMPKYKEKLSEQEIKLIADYVKTLK